jgi:hypothetical protein
MKKFGLCTILAMSAFCLLTAASPLRAYADSVTLTLQNVGPNQVDGYYAYPYKFSANNPSGPATISLMCVSFDNEIYVGETWTADVYALTDPGFIPAVDASGENGGTLQEYEEAAWLFNDAQATAFSNNPTQSESDQSAVWYLFQPGTGDSSGNNGQLTFAQNYVLGNPNSSLYSQFVVYVPVSGSQSEGELPQTFIGDPPPTPEPSRLLLLGTGLLGLAVVVFRKAKPSGQVSHS